MNIEKPFAVLLAAGVVLLPLPGSAPAGCRPVKHHHVHQQAAVVFQPTYPAYYYQVGQNLQLRAMVQQELQALLAQPQQPQQLTTPCTDGTCQTPQTLPLTAAPDRWALVRANCVSCHETNADAKAAVDMSDLSSLTCETKLKMAAAILDGVMPPKKALDPNALGQLLGEIVGAETVEK